MADQVELMLHAVERLPESFDADRSGKRPALPADVFAHG
jgi:hypothetical protein